MDNPAPPSHLGVAQSAEHPVWGGEVAGSLPVTQTILQSIYQKLLADQPRLDDDSRRVLYENLFELYTEEYHG